MMDKFSSGWAVLIIGILECVCIGWVYGAERFGKDITLMIGPKLNNRYIYMFWTVCWRFISPLLLVVLVIISIVKYTPLKTDNYVLPNWVIHTLSFLLTKRNAKLSNVNDLDECHRVAHDRVYFVRNHIVGAVLRVRCHVHSQTKPQVVDRAVGELGSAFAQE